MSRKPDTATEPPLPLQLLRCLLEDQRDRAIALGLMDYVAAAGDDALDPAHPNLSQRLLHEQTQLRRAWLARERYRARGARLARRAAERQAQRAPLPAPAAERPPPSLPPLAAAILARAKAKAADKGKA